MVHGAPSSLSLPPTWSSSDLEARHTVVRGKVRGTLLTTVVRGKVRGTLWSEARSECRTAGGTQTQSWSLSLSSLRRPEECVVFREGREGGQKPEGQLE